MEKEADVPKDSVDGQQLDVADPVDTMDEQAAAKEKLTGNEPNKIQFTAINLVDGKNGEAKVDIHLVQTSIGMGKEELMKYANEPFWVRLRMFLFILFWVGWLAMLVGAVVIILVAPRCPPAPKLDWYQKTVIYQVDVKSFKDSDGDDVGDLTGLKLMLDYLVSLNVKTMLLNALYAVAPTTNGILNHTLINSQYGTMTDMDDLIAAAKKDNLKIILDFIPNHTSDKHPWFEASVKRKAPYENFYVWADAQAGGGPPSNWLSVNGDSAWELNKERNQYYLHTFGKNEPDLNLRNELVKEHLKEILQFWLDKGVDGFKVIGASHLFEDEFFKDEPLGTDRKVTVVQYGDLSHAYTVDHSDNFALFAEWQQLLNNYSESTGVKKILLADVSQQNVESVLKYYGNESYSLIQFPVNTQLTELTKDSSPNDLKEKLDLWINALQNYTSSWPNWLLGSPNTKRLATRVGPELLDGIHMVAMLSKGTPITYFGDEFGMTESSERGKLAFTSQNKTSDEKPLTVSAETQMEDSSSHISIFKRLVELRNQPAVNFGIQEYPIITNETFSMIRVRKGSPGYMVVLNMGVNSTIVDFSKSDSTYLPDNARVEIRSHNIDSGPLFDMDHPKIKLNHVPLEPKQSVVLSFVPKFKS